MPATPVDGERGNTREDGKGEREREVNRKRTVDRARGCPELAGPFCHAAVFSSSREQRTQLIVISRIALALQKHIDLGICQQSSDGVLARRLRDDAPESTTIMSNRRGILACVHKQQCQNYCLQEDSARPYACAAGAKPTTQCSASADDPGYNSHHRTQCSASADDPGYNSHRRDRYSLSPCARRNSLSRS